MLPHTSPGVYHSQLSEFVSTNDSTRYLAIYVVSMLIGAVIAHLRWYTSSKLDEDTMKCVRASLGIIDRQTAEIEKLKAEKEELQERLIAALKDKNTHLRDSERVYILAEKQRALIYDQKEEISNLKQVVSLQMHTPKQNMLEQKQTMQNPQPTTVESPSYRRESI